MRRTTLLAVLTVWIALAATPAVAATQGGLFTVSCPGIDVSGHEAGWGAAMLVDSGEGVELGSVAHFWSLTQETWVNPKKIPATGKPDAVGWLDYPGEHHDAISGCTGTLEWYFLGDHYWAKLYDLEVSFT
jgi:hypothetical protein